MNAARIIDVSIVNVADDPFGQVISGGVALAAPLQNVCSCNVVYSNYDCQREHQDLNGYIEVDMGDGYFNIGHRRSLRPNEFFRSQVFGGLDYTGKSGVIHQALAYLHISSAIVMYLCIHYPRSCSCDLYTNWTCYVHKGSRRECDWQM